MVLKLYGYPASTTTRLIIAVIEEKKLSYEFHHVNYEGREHKSPAYLEKQPFGLFPYIDDDGFILYETRAIARYIDEKYGDQETKLMPTDLKAKALFEQAASIEAFNFYPHANRAMEEKYFKPKFRGETTDEVVFNSAMETLAAKLDVYDKILSKQKYLAGDELTLADLFHLPLGVLPERVGSDIMTDPARPNVKRWWNDVVSWPSWVKALTIQLPSL